jgi:serine/threonine-protein kinase
MAPEQVRGARDLDKRVDIYALGILLFELLIGRVPFDAESDYELMKLHTEAPLPSVRQLRSDVPSILDEVLSRACAKNRDERFASCEQFLAALSPLSPRAESDHGGEEEPPPGSAIASRAAWTATAAGAHAAGFRGGTAPDPNWARPSLPLATQAIGYSTPPGGTHEGASLPPAIAARPARKAMWVGACALALLGTGIGLFESGLLPQRHRGESSRRSDAGSGQTATSGSTGGATSKAYASGMPDAKAAIPSPLSQLVGPWKSDSLRDYDAVLLDDVIEFRIVHASQHPGQGYRDGEARFALRAIPGDERSFAVEDRIRPVPPKGYEYDETRSRGTCQAAWSAVDGRPLRARFDGKTLAVELVKIETELSRFVVETGNKISGCQRLRDAPAEKISSMLTPYPER